MTKDEGSVLPRGGEKIAVAKSKATFTAKLPDPDRGRMLAELEAVESVEPVTRSVVQVKVAAEDDETAERRRDELMARLREDDGLVVHHEYLDESTPAMRYRLLDEVIVKFDPDAGRARIAEILDEYGLVVKKEYSDLANTFLLVVTDEARANPIKVANRLEALPDVVYAEPALVNEFEPFAPPTDEQFRAQWHLYSGESQAPDIARDADASVYAAWQTTKGSRAIVVAVLDDGFALDNEDFQGDGKVVEPVDFRSGGTQPVPRGRDYHGTPCAGVAIAEENGLNCVGVSPRCAFMPVRFPLNAADPWLIEIFNYVSARAHVASCSWGPAPGNAPLHSAVRETFANLARRGGKDGKGLVIVFAAGNYDAPLDATVDYQIRWRGFDGVQWRTFTATGRIVNGYAAHPDTIAVGACSSLNRKSLYSNWGRPLDVVAPSNNFDPTTFARLPGRGITAPDNEGAGEDFSPGKRYTNSFGGTSSATPLVAGVAALVKSANPSLSALEIADIIRGTADKIVDSSADPLYGTARGAYQNGHSEWLGNGKVNARLAVEEAVARLPVALVVEKEQRPALAVPDAFRPGVTAAIDVGEPGLVADVEVAVDATHPWSGDLHLTLTSPAGTRVPLRRGIGGSRDDIHDVYTRATTPALASLTNEPAQGDWLLTVADVARRDVGTLDRWRLKLTLAGDNRVRVRATESRLIPDNDERGVRSTLAVDRDGGIRGVAVGVEISHTWAGDLRLMLITPSGEEILLREPNGMRADGISERFDAGSVPELGRIAAAGLDARGLWELHVADVVRRDVGKLNSWELELTLA